MNSGGIGNRSHDHRLRSMLLFFDFIFLVPLIQLAGVVVFRARRRLKPLASYVDPRRRVGRTILICRWWSARYQRRPTVPWSAGVLETVCCFPPTVAHLVDAAERVRRWRVLDVTRPSVDLAASSRPPSV